MLSESQVAFTDKGTDQFMLKQVLYYAVLLFLRTKFEGRANLIGSSNSGAFYSIFSDNNQKYYNMQIC